MQEQTGSRFCYVVLAHTEAPAALRLARRVRALSPGSTVLLRHAQDAGFLTAEEARQAGADVLHSSFPVTWGEWSLTAAAIEALQHAVATYDADWFVLLSGQDYPLRNLRGWERDLLAGGAGASFERLAPRDQDWQYSWRVVHVPAPLRRLPRTVKRQLERTWQVGSRPLIPLVRLYRFGEGGSNWGAALRRRPAALAAAPVVVTSGSFWLTCSRAALERLLLRHAADPSLPAWFARTLTPDEHYLQSLLLDDPRISVADRPTTYAHFPQHSWNASVITLDLLERAWASGAPFTRKVPAHADDVVARADELAEQDRLQRTHTPGETREG